ncbi:MAG: lamin tail domain-containing protein [Candidatus Altiarchaeota archaeon]
MGTMRKIIALLVLIFLAQQASATVTISLSANPNYGVNETISFSGTITNVTNASSVSLANATVNVTLENSTGDVLLASTLVSSGSGTFTGTLTAPSVSGTYQIKAGYNDSETLWEGELTVVVSEHAVDTINIYPDKATYYIGESTISLTASAVRSVAGTEVGVADVSINGTIRYANETVISGFNCTTGSTGSCDTTLAVPSAVGTYLIEANNFLGSTTVSVISLDVTLSTRDDTGDSLKAVYSPGDNARIRVKVSFNGTVDSSVNYTFSGSISYPNGTQVKAIYENQTDAWDRTTQTGWHNFTIDGNFTAGSYMASVTVTDGASNVSQTVFFSVQSWSITLEKISGFEYSLSAFPGSTAWFKITVKNLTTGGSITTLNNTNFNITLSSSGDAVGSYNITANSTYNFTFAMPSSVGAYTLRVQVTHAGTTQSTEVTLYAINAVASATPVNSEGELKELFDGSEYVHIQVTLRNQSSTLNITNLTVTEVRDEDGDLVSYSYQGNWSGDVNGTKEWRKNISAAMLKLDNPNTGGMYTVKIEVSSQSAGGSQVISIADAIQAGQTAVANTKFIVDPYTIWAYPKGEDESWGRYQFAVGDKVYFDVTVMKAQHQYGSAMMAFESGYGMGAGGTGGYPVPEVAPSRQIASSTENVKKMPNSVAAAGPAQHSSMAGSGASSTAVSGATVNVSKIINDQTFEELPLSEVNWSCTQTSSTGSSTCSIYPINSSGSQANWSGGRYHVVFQVTGPDNVTTGLGHSGFEVRSFYIYAWSTSWMNKPTANITFTVQMYDAANTQWWNWYYGGSNGSTGGLNGRVSVLKVLFNGGMGEWIWPPINYNYTGTLPSNKQITNGQGNFTLNAPTGNWGSGSYTLVLKAERTDANGTVLDTDYGEAWFDIRLWDAWASPVDANNSYQWTQSFAASDTVNLFVNIHNAGSWLSGEDLTNGPVTVSVKKIEDFTSWPPNVLDSSNYTANSITVSKSADSWSAYYGGSFNASDYLINITPAGGVWPTGYYNVVLDVNGTDTGFGYFNVISFYASAQFVNSSGSYAYSTRGTGPVYFNVSSSSDTFGGEPINTSIKSLSLMMWSSSGLPTEYTYPDDLSVSPASIGGSALVQVNNTGGGWPAGWYNGEIVLNDSTGATATAWIWFESRPFVVNAYTTSYEVGRSSNVTATLSILDPLDWYTQLPGTYVIDSITDMDWGPMGGVGTAITNYTPAYFTQNGSGASLTITPNNGAWSSGYHNLVVRVRDNATNSSGETWLYFNIVPFTVSATQDRWTYGSSENVTVSVNVSDPLTGNPVTANLSRVYETDWSNCWTWPCPTTEYNYTPQLINGTANVSIIAPAEGWSSQWHSLTLVFADPSDPTTTRDQWISFDSRAFNVYLSQSAWTYRRTQNVTATAQITDLDYVTPKAANVTQVYEMNWSNCVYTPAYSCQQIDYSFSPTYINGTGNLTIAAPAGGWSPEYHNLNVIFADPNSPSATQTAWLYFDSRSFVGSASPSTYSAAPDSAVDFSLYVYEPDWYTPINVSITNITYTSYNYSSWTYDPQQQANWTLLNTSSSEPMEGSNVYGPSMFRLYPPEDNWSVGQWGYGSYNVYVYMQTVDTAEAGSLSGYFSTSGTAMTTTSIYYTTSTLGTDCATNCNNCYDSTNCTNSSAGCVWDSSISWCYPASTYTSSTLGTTTTTIAVACDSSNYSSCGTADSISSEETDTFMCGSQQWYSVTTNDTCTITWTMTDDYNADFDLHTLWNGSCPTTSDYDCRPYTSSNQESCSNYSSAGTYYAMVNQYTNWGGYYNITVNVTCGNISTTSTTSTTSTSTTSTTTTTISTVNVLISEVFYDTNGTDSNEEFIELYNPTTSEINITNWKLGDNDGNYTLVIASSFPGESYLTFARNDTGFYNLFGFYPNASNLTLSLANTGDYVYLYNTSGSVIDFVAWENYVTGWNISAAEGYSIHRYYLIDTDTSSDWFNGMSTPNNPGPMI